MGDNVNVSSKAPTSVKAKACLEAIAAIDENLELEDLRGLLEDTEILLRRRNEIMHGLLSMTKQGLIRANPRTGDQTLVTASDVYELAREIWNVQSAPTQVHYLSVFLDLFKIISPKN